ncbi:hypothetical protein OF83DRAFT_1059853 [Amylostereum chailletii]|nr:hypothetical protein OF83DRAFT_1059853 [Amylostereum chailletii]
MAPKEPTRAQLSSRLAYSQTTPAFLQRLQNRIAGVQDEDEDDEFEDDGSGRPPIPRRPAIPERPSDDPGSADEDDADESPQVVVLKEGKHLSAREVENEKRKARGLSPIPDPMSSVSNATQELRVEPKKPADTKQKNSLSFSSGRTSTKSAKRKAVGDALDDDKLDASAKKTKKTKKTPKVALSFADDA